jgi:uncharacterized protein (DUF1501 family)
MKAFGSMSRRQLLRIGVGSCMSLSLGRFLSLQAAEGARPPVAKAKSVIHIFLPGALGQHESWDPKPEAATEYRGEFGAIGTKVPGMQLCELLKKTAGVADKLTLLRGVWHTESAHERGQMTMLTGWKPSPAVIYPSMGSIVAHELGARKNLPPYVTIPETPAQGGTGYLSPTFGAFSVGGDPSRPGFTVQDLALPAGVDQVRFDTRRSLKEVVDAQHAHLARSGAIEPMSKFYQNAYSMISSPEARKAFDLTAELPAIRETYGQNLAGQGLLMARRLVNAGVRFVTVSYGSWDHHQNLKQGVANQLPQFDQAYAALIADLAASGQLDDTLVIVSTDFGRTPKMNSAGGRDHWAKCFSVALAGGGVKRGLVHGVSDATGAEPTEGAVSAEDLSATIFHLMGISPEKRLMAMGTRPIAINGGKVVPDILA